MSKDRKRMIVDVLTQFYQSNLASHDAREWIAEEIVKKSIKVASDICVFTNNNITIEKV